MGGGPVGITGPGVSTVLRFVYIVYATLAMYLVLIPWTGLMTFLELFFAFLRIRPGTWFIAKLWANGIFMMLGHRIHVVNREYLDTNKNYLLVLNHTSMFDFPALMAVFPLVSWLGRDNLLKIPVFGTMLRAIDYIAIYPGDVERSKQSIQEAIDKSSKIHIAIFPEGTRTLDGKMKEFRKGFTYIVRGTDLDVLPITLNGLFTWKPKYQRYLTPMEKVHMVFHPVQKNEKLRSMSNEEMATYMKGIIESGLLPGRKMNE
jgi:1-acyl-sn-glycerol-3-phosphate acyltransferase